MAPSVLNSNSAQESPKGGDELGSQSDCSNSGEQGPPGTAYGFQHSRGARTRVPQTFGRQYHTYSLLMAWRLLNLLAKTALSR